MPKESAVGFQSDTITLPLLLPIVKQICVHGSNDLLIFLRREKKWRRNRFDLSDSVHACEYQNVQKPFSKRTGERIEPAHKLEVRLEPDNFTEEK